MTIKVTQTARDAAADYLIARGDPLLAEWIRKGDADHSLTAQALAAAEQRGRIAMRAEAAKVARYDGMVFACKKRKTSRLGLPRDAYPTEISREIATAIEALPDSEGEG